MQARREHRWWWRGRPLSVRSLVLAVALLPTAAFGLLAAVDGSGRLADYRDAGAVVAGTVRLDGLLQARVDLTDEDVATAAIVAGRSLGLDPTAVGRALGEDVTTEEAAARRAVAGDTVLDTTPALRGALARLRTLRAQVDGGRVTVTDVIDGFAAVTGTVDTAWLDAYRQLDQRADSLPDPRFTATAAAVAAAFDAYRAGLNELGDANTVGSGDTGAAAVEALVSDGARLQAALADLGRPGPRTAAALRRYRDDPSVRGFAARVAALEDGAIGGETPALGSDLPAYEATFRQAVAAGNRLTDVVRAASADLRAQARAEQGAAADAVMGTAAAGLSLLAVALVAAVGLARAVSRPLGRIEAGAARIRAGEFGLDPLPVDGPRELAETAAAFNEMARVLRLVEAQTVALATDDLDAPEPATPLPGRTGAALGRALDHLRTSLRAAERRRRRLERDATHDGLTGLLNRAAVYDGLGRQLARARRDGGLVAVLFLDLDGLKATNDRYGHTVGDTVIAATAGALRGATREADVVGRVGGDEFLVAGQVSTPAEATALGRRVHDAVAGAGVSSPDGRLPLACSIGVATTDGRETDPHAVVRRADEALYRAKRAGRDRVVTAAAPAG